MAANPVTTLVLAAIGCSAVIAIATGGVDLPTVVLGMLGPLAAAVGSWLAVERVHGRAPERVSGLMIKLFGAKMLLFAAYVTAVLLVLDSGETLFVVSFVGHYVLLHLMEAFYLRRLFADRAAEGRLSAS